MFNLKNYWDPTPKFFRAIGDSLLTLFSTASAYGIIMDDKYLALLCMLCGVAGKFLTNFFSEPKQDGI
jgi:hypothetical protein